MNMAEEFYKEIQKPLEQILVAAYGMDAHFAQITVQTNGGFELDVFSKTKPDESYFVDAVRSTNFHSNIVIAERSEFGHVDQ